MSEEVVYAFFLGMAILLCAGEPDLYDAIMVNLIGDSYEIKQDQPL